MFSLVGKPYLVNVEHILHINAGRQQLTFDINQPSMCKKQSIKATPNALRNLRQALDAQSSMRQVQQRVGNSINGGFANYMSAPKMEDIDYEIGDDDVLMLGR